MFQKGASDILNYTKRPLLYRDYCACRGPTGHCSCVDDAMDNGTIHASPTGGEVLGRYGLHYLGRFVRRLGYSCYSMGEKIEEEGNKKEALGSN